MNGALCTLRTLGSAGKQGRQGASAGCGPLLPPRMPPRCSCTAPSHQPACPTSWPVCRAANPTVQRTAQPAVLRALPRWRQQRRTPHLCGGQRQGLPPAHAGEPQLRRLQAQPCMHAKVRSGPAAHALRCCRAARWRHCSRAPSLRPWVDPSASARTQSRCRPARSRCRSWRAALWRWRWPQPALHVGPAPAPCMLRGGHSTVHDAGVVRSPPGMHCPLSPSLAAAPDCSAPAAAANLYCRRGRSLFHAAAAAWTTCSAASLFDGPCFTHVPPVAHPTLFFFLVAVTAIPPAAARSCVWRLAEWPARRWWQALPRS